MTCDFGGILRFSYQRMVLILFRPFRYRKWLVFWLLAWLSGQLSFGGNIGGNLGNVIRPAQKNSSALTSPDALITVSQPLGTQSSLRLVQQKFSFKDLAQGIRMQPGLLVVIVVIIAAIIGLFVFFLWLGSIFYFVFLENIIKNTAEIKTPFKTYRSLGTSYFGWNLIFGIINLSIFIAIIAGAIGYLSNSGQLADLNEQNIGPLLVALLPFIVVFVLVFCASAIVHWFVQNFALPVMLRENVGVIPGVAKAWALLWQRPREIALYLLISFGFSVGLGAAFILATVIMTLLAVLLLGLLGIALFLITKLIPAVIAQGLIIVFSIIGGSLFFFFMLSLSFLFLPVAVFFKLFNLKFLGDIAPPYDLITAGG